jgi:hypothetical protein
VTEQIEAINELSKIVARYAGETAQGAAPAAAPAGLAPRPLRAEDLRPAPKPPAPEAPAPAAPFGRPTGAPAASAAAPKPAPAPAAAPAMPAAAPPEPRPRAGGNGETRGWVADLLRRASTDEEAPAAASAPAAAPAREPVADQAGGRRSPAQVVESLNSLSIDIARAIDHEASVELWDRYKRGERNAFTRRLYTLQGQKTFDELRRKYESDGDFRGAVDNYIADFERLLSQVSGPDHDPAMARMYLTSDTGKVYTMLAHAAGRLS